MPHIVLPTLHSGQIKIYQERDRLNAVRCGRRFGKTKLMVAIAANMAAKGKKVGLFTPEYKQLLEPWKECKAILKPVIDTASKNEGQMTTTTGGLIDIWSTNDNELAGRGREYDEVLLDEAAFSKAPDMLQEIWPKSIKPTMLTRRGRAWAFSTPKGVDPDNFFWAACNDPKLEFKQHHAPTSANPYVPPDELEKERLSNHPLVFKQEFLAEFVDWSGVAFFAADKWMGPDGQPLPWPDKCDSVFATVDTAVKDGKEHDGTAVIFWAVSRFHGAPLMILDWDIVQIEGAMLETWLPTIYQRLEQLALVCGARMGSLGAFIEDKASGTILLQQATRRGWPATPIDSKLTAAGKDEGAISISGYHYMGQVKLSAPAHDKVTMFKGQTRNHLMTQVLGYRIGDKDAHKRADDLFDAYRYGVSIALGDSNGY